MVQYSFANYRTISMKVISVNASLPKTITRDGKQIVTGIFKTPVPGPVEVRTLNLDGDGQADLSVHGGVYKAVYAYPSEHYVFWRSVYPKHPLPWGAFGENLTTTGMEESSVGIGDQYRIGTVVLQVTQPRQPCFKLGAKFEDDGIIKTFKSSGRSGFYLSVVEEGHLQAGDTIELVHRDPAAFTISDALQLYSTDNIDGETIARALRTRALPPGLRRRAESLKG
jgi:MOSC domain-containing protein YiiM